jgi:hypothetical protein
MAIMAVLMYAKDLQRPIKGAVAPLDCHPELIHVDEHASGDLKDPKRREVIPEGEYPKLDFFLQSMKGFNGGLFLGDLEVIKMLGCVLVGVHRAAFVVDEGGHVLL